MATIQRGDELVVWGYSTRMTINEQTKPSLRSLTDILDLFKNNSPLFFGKVVFFWFFDPSFQTTS